MKHADVIVVGGGHAGVEAAAAAARFGATVILVTFSREQIGVMSCNPAIGGVGKGHIVREIDALDGMMGRAADAAAIQYRLLNRSKGHAVRGPRVQADRSLYRQAVQRLLGQIPNLHILDGEVVDVSIDHGRVTGVILRDGAALTAPAVVLTNGTFLRGRMFVGTEQTAGGRSGDPASERLADRLRGLLEVGGRLKTGTPPRLDGRSIDWQRLERQESDASPMFMSFQTTSTGQPQISCGIAHTNLRTHEVVRQNLHLSAMHSGLIEGIGPRYCPSIEDKITRFADKESHQVFLEPEGLDTDLVYPNGLSTSLPAEVQLSYLTSIVGLEQVRVTQFGYAVEYDFFDPRGLSSSLETHAVGGLFLAGQVNGTTGYEEAAGQGLVAGAAAAGATLSLSRGNSYIGVMVDDLTTQGVTEPYRMFTSRAEFRLSLRADNADQRLTETGREAGIVGEDRWIGYATKAQALEKAQGLLKTSEVTSAKLRDLSLPSLRDGRARSVAEYLGGREPSEAEAAALVPELLTFAEEVRTQAIVDAVYAPYVQRQQGEVEQLRKDSARIIPAAFVYADLPGLSHELKEKLMKVRPSNVAQAKGIPGMTPAAMIAIIAALGRQLSDVAA